MVHGERSRSRHLAMHSAIAMQCHSPFSLVATGSQSETRVARDRCISRVALFKVGAQVGTRLFVGQLPSFIATHCDLVTLVDPR